MGGYWFTPAQSDMLNTSGDALKGCSAVTTGDRKSV